MFVVREVQAEVGFVLAQARLARFAQTGRLLAISQGAYGAGLAALVPADPPGSVPHPAGLVRARFGNLIARGNSAYAALRWEAVNLDGGPFPALDADLTLRPAGDAATTVSLTGIYRLPAGTWSDGLARPVVRQVATATTHAFLNRIAAALTIPGPAAARNGAMADGLGLPPAAQAP